MHLLYLDESGNPRNPQQPLFILAGVTAFERQTWWVESELTRIAARFLPEEPDRAELHGSPMFGGRQFWPNFPLPDRISAIKDVLAIIRPNMRIFAAVVDKSLVGPKIPSSMPSNRSAVASTTTCAAATAIATPSAA